MKTVLKILAVLVLLLVLALLALFFLFDPNALKPRIEAMAREQGVALSIRGDIGWQFWPSIGIEINDLAVAHVDAPEDLLAELDSASLLVATRPLLRRELMVEHVRVDGARVHLQVDAEGVGNWEAFLPAVETPGQMPAEVTTAMEERAARAQAEAEEAASGEATREAGDEDPQSLSLAVDDISFTNLVLNYADQTTGTTLEAELRQLQLADVNLEARPIALQLDWRARLRDSGTYRDDPLVVAGAMETRITVAEDLRSFTLPRTLLKLSIASAGRESGLALEFEGSVNLPATGPGYSGRIVLQPFNPKQLLASLQLPVPETSLDTALTEVAFSTNFVGTANTLTLSELQLQLDGSRLDGEIAITDLSRQALVVTLTGDALNADDYLPPGAEESPEQAASGEPLIPLETVRGLDAQVRLNLGSLVFSDLTFTNLRLRLNAAEGVVDLSEASAEAYEGKLTSRARLDASGETAVMDFNADVEGFQIAPVMRDLELDESLKFAGSLRLTAEGRSRGVTTEEIIQALVMEAEFRGDQVTMAPINVEKYFCQAVAMMRDEEVAEGEEPVEEKTWPEQTNMQPLAGRIRMVDEVITIESFDASVEALVLGVRGRIDLAQDNYDLQLPLRLVEKTTSENGCTVKSNYWLDRTLELLRCRGSLSAMKPLSDCGISGRGLEDMAKEYAGQRLQRELLKHLGGEEQEADGEGGEKDATQQAVEGLFQQLLRPKEDEKQTTE